MVGCSSTSVGLPELYVASLTDKNDVSVRIGFLGICVTSSVEEWVCSDKVANLYSAISAADGDQNILNMGMVVKEKILFPWFMFVLVLSCCNETVLISMR